MPNFEDVRSSLEIHRAELRTRLQRVAQHTRHRKEPLPADFAEQATELENSETLAALDDGIEQELQNIELALTRIDAGTYDRCRACGAEIGEARLSAVPVTALCIGCANDEARVSDRV